MKIFSGIFENRNISVKLPVSDYENVLLFDIETTGFSPKSTTLYMIGFCYYREQQWNYTILFNEDNQSELPLLRHFLSVLAEYKTLVTYNGDTFDLPYLKTKIKQYQQLIEISKSTVDKQHDPLYLNALETCESMDLYSILKRYRKFLHLPDLKLKTVEKCFGVDREDVYTGGELIAVYKSYIKNPSLETEEMLIQHNYDDIQAMIPMLSILSFNNLKNITVNHITDVVLNFEEEKMLSLAFRHTLFVPTELSIATETMPFFSIRDKEGLIKLNVTRETLRYYLTNWKDYIYLPVEHKVIHKSIGAFVDSPYKEKATKDNCYLEQPGEFIQFPFSKDKMGDALVAKFGGKLFQKDRNDKTWYLPITGSSQADSIGLYSDSEAYQLLIQNIIYDSIFFL